MTSEGGWFMTQAVKRGWRPSRALTLVAGLALAGGVLLAAAPDQPAKDKPTATVPAKEKDKPTGKVDSKPLPPRQKIITLPKEASSDVVEMVSVINKGLEAGWNA